MFSFGEVTQNDITLHLQNINVHKVTVSDNIPGKILKLAADVLNVPLTMAVNKSVSEFHFPFEAKVAAISPIVKSDEKIHQSDYRPVSILNATSKIFANIIKEQIVPYFEDYWSIFVSAYRKAYNPQHVLMRIVENWRVNLDEY